MQFGADDDAGSAIYAHLAHRKIAKSSFKPKPTTQGFGAALTSKDGNQIENCGSEAPIIMASLLSYLFPIAL